MTRATRADKIKRGDTIVIGQDEYAVKASRLVNRLQELILQTPSGTTFKTSSFVDDLWEVKQ